jgi:hypothetical protein
MHRMVLMSYPTRDLRMRKSCGSLFSRLAARKPGGRGWEGYLSYLLWHSGTFYPRDSVLDAPGGNHDAIRGHLRGTIN